MRGMETSLKDISADIACPWKAANHYDATYSVD